MGAMRLRLTANSMSSLPTRADPHPDSGGLHAGVEHQVTELAGFYDGLAAEVARPGRNGPAAAQIALPSSRIAAAATRPCGHAAGYQSDALWVGHHLDHLEAHAVGLSGPAEQLATLRRRPWWR
jgi:hypothetical protein